MTNDTAPRPRVLSARRIALLATTVAGLGALALAGQPLFTPDTLPGLSAPAHAQNANVARPAGFADIVEKVKPAVVSVRVKVEAGPQLSSDDFQIPQGQQGQQGSPFEFFFKRFGMPNGQGGQGGQGGPGMPRRHNFAMGQGSGFFISPDGFAVTNNHVVDKAETVEVTTDEGKTYTAKVI